MTEEEAYLAIAKKLLLISDKLDTLELCMHDVQAGIYTPSGEKDLDHDHDDDDDDDESHEAAVEAR